MSKSGLTTENCPIKSGNFNVYPGIKLTWTIYSYYKIGNLLAKNPLYSSVHMLCSTVGNTVTIT